MPGKGSVHKVQESIEGLFNGFVMMDGSVSDPEAVAYCGASAHNEERG